VEYRAVEAFDDNADTAFRALEAFGVEVEQDASFPTITCIYRTWNAPRGRELFPTTLMARAATGQASSRDWQKGGGRQIPVYLEHRAAGVIINDDGRVVGVRVQTRTGKSPRGDARRSSPAPGGFTHNEDMRRYYLGVELLAMRAHSPTRVTSTVLPQRLESRSCTWTPLIWHRWCSRKCQPRPGDDGRVRRSG